MDHGSCRSENICLLFSHLNTILAKIPFPWKPGVFSKALGPAELQVITSVPVQFSLQITRFCCELLNCFYVWRFLGFSFFFLSSEISLVSRILTTQRIQIFWRISSGIQQETKLPQSTLISWSTFYPLGWVSQKDNGKKKITLLQPLFSQYAPGIDKLKNEWISYFLACTWIPVSCILSLPLKFTSLFFFKIFIYYLCIWLCQFSALAHGIFDHCGSMWDL